MTKSEKLPIIDVVCAVLLDETGKVLVARRPLEKSLGGLWEFPGGKVEDGEALSDALIREIHEELGTEVVVESDGLGVLGTFDHALNDVVIRLHPIVCRLAEKANPPEALEHLELQWLPIAEETEIDWAPGDRRIFAALRSGCEKSERRRSRPTGRVFRVLFWMTFLGNAMLFGGVVYEIRFLESMGLVLFFPALPLCAFVDSIVGGLLNAKPTLNWWHNFYNHTQVVLLLAINAWLLPRIWKWLDR